MNKHDLRSSQPVTANADPVPRGRIAGGWALFRRFQHQLANLTAFTALQAASYLIPVVTIPYFARTLGIAGMGVLAIAGAVALAAGVLMDYAIQLSGTRFAASNGDDREAIGRYLSTTMLVKLIILVPILACLCLAAFFVDPVADHFSVFFWSLASAVMMCLFPQWLFQGMLAMPLAARILVVSRVGAAAAAMLLVRGADDIVIVPATQALAGAGALAAAIHVLKRRLDIRLTRSAPEQTRAMFRDNWTLFSATLWGAVYAHGGVIIMSTMLTTTSIGVYSIAQKISQAVVSMFNVAAQTGFPTFVRVHTRSPERLGPQVRVFMAAVGGAAAIGLLALALLRYQIYGFFSGQHSPVGVTVLLIWLAASFFTILSVSLNPLMVVFRLDAAMARVYRLIGLSFLIGAPIACHLFGVFGMAAAMLVTEAVMACFCISIVISAMRRAAALRRA